MHGKRMVEASLALPGSVIRGAAPALYSYSLHSRLISRYTGQDACGSIRLTSRGWFSTVHVYDSASWGAACPRDP